jgi:hypothetical protein
MRQNLRSVWARSAPGATSNTGKDRRCHWRIGASVPDMAHGCPDARRSDNLYNVANRCGTVSASLRFGMRFRKRCLHSQDFIRRHGGAALHIV